jgi:hypothetical protein
LALRPSRNSRFVKAVSAGSGSGLGSARGECEPVDRDPQLET